MNDSVLVLKEFFIGQPDRCERLISIVQLCCDIYSKKSEDEKLLLSIDDIGSVSSYYLCSQDV